MKGPPRLHVLLAAALALVFGAGPTVGDVGGCGATVEPLDVSRFARARKTVDCDRCKECGLSSQRCRDACDPKVPSDVAFPARCFPLYHDGEVCLRALLAASCGDYALYVDDRSRYVPSECEFCREGGDP